MTSEIAARLNQVGILTYADLAAQSITRISELLGIESTVTGSTIAEWLTIARTFATGA